MDILTGEHAITRYTASLARIPAEMHQERDVVERHVKNLEDVQNCLQSAREVELKKIHALAESKTRSKILFQLIILNI